MGVSLMESDDSEGRQRERNKTNEAISMGKEPAEDTRGRARTERKRFVTRLSEL